MLKRAFFAGAVAGVLAAISFAVSGADAQVKGDPPFTPGDISPTGLTVVFLADAGCTVAPSFDVNLSGYAIVPNTGPVTPVGAVCPTLLKVATRAAMANMGFTDGGKP